MIVARIANVINFTLFLVFKEINAAQISQPYQIYEISSFDTLFGSCPASVCPNTEQRSILVHIRMNVVPNVRAVGSQ